MGKFKWPIKARKYSKPGKKLQHGEIRCYALKRWPNDRALRAEVTRVCCGCGFEHLYCYEVFSYDKGKHWFLGIRPYANERTRPKKNDDKKGRDDK